MNASTTTNCDDFAAYSGDSGAAREKQAVDPDAAVLAANAALAAAEDMFRQLDDSLLMDGDDLMMAADASGSGESTHRVFRAKT